MGFQQNLEEGPRFLKTLDFCKITVAFRAFEFHFEIKIWKSLKIYHFLLKFAIFSGVSGIRPTTLHYSHLYNKTSYLSQIASKMKDVRKRFGVFTSFITTFWFLIVLMHIFGNLGRNSWICPIEVLSSQ